VERPPAARQRAATAVDITTCHGKHTKQKTWRTAKSQALACRLLGEPPSQQRLHVPLGEPPSQDKLHALLGRTPKQRTRQTVRTTCSAPLTPSIDIFSLNNIFQFNFSKV
jgi:hypothetical protein